MQKKELLCLPVELVQKNRSMQTKSATQPSKATSVQKSTLNNNKSNGFIVRDIKHAFEQFKKTDEKAQLKIERSSSVHSKYMKLARDASKKKQMDNNCGSKVQKASLHESIMKVKEQKNIFQERCARMEKNHLRIV